MSRDIALAVSKLFSSRIYKVARFFLFMQRECSSIEKIECSEKDVDLW